MNENTDNQPASNDDSLIRGQVRHQQISARVPEQVARGVFSTGAIVLMGNTEFILDFVLRMQRPHQIVQRVILPHAVLPQMITALEKNLEKYEERFGCRPQILNPVAETESVPQTPPGTVPGKFANSAPVPEEFVSNDGASQVDVNAPNEDAPSGYANIAPQGTDQPSASEPSPEVPSEAPPESSSKVSPQAHKASPQNIDPVNAVQNDASRPTIEDIYDELRLPDDGLMGAYANAVMISHSAAEFNFDFITNFYPRSVVCARIFISAPQVMRLLDAVKNTYEEFQKRLLANRRQQLKQMRDQQESQNPPVDPNNPYYPSDEDDTSELA